MLNRRSLITGLISFAAAPAIVRVESIMPVKVIDPVMTLQDYTERILAPMMEKYWRNVIVGKMVTSYTDGDFKALAISDEEFYKGEQ